MSFPVRFVVITYNLWAEARWPERENALRAFLRKLAPDILCVQELRPSTRTVLDEELPGHKRVDDPFAGWIQEGNIYWSTKMFECLEYGAEDIGILEPLRRLFWVRLRLKGDERTLFVSTAHYTYQGNKREADEGFSPRLTQARRTLEVLNALVKPEEPLLFMGDLNDAVNAIRILRQGGLADSFTARGTLPRPTHPAIPTASGTPHVLDWQFHRGPIQPMVSEVVDFYAGDLAPSDHKPLSVAYSLF
jgi:endonuclease/exonuclease/phosphatase (EEP) superfamily protein YafD